MSSHKHNNGDENRMTKMKYSNIGEWLDDFNGYNKFVRPQIPLSLLNEDRFTSASGLFVKHNVPNMDVLVRRLAFSLYKRVLQSDYPLLNRTTNSMYFQSSMIYNQWKNPLYTK